MSTPDNVDGLPDDFKVKKAAVEKPKKCKRLSKDAPKEAIQANHRERMKDRAIRRDSFHRQAEVARAKGISKIRPNLRKDHPKAVEYANGLITYKECYA